MDINSRRIMGIDTPEMWKDLSIIARNDGIEKFNKIVEGKTIWINPNNNTCTTEVECINYYHDLNDIQKEQVEEYAEWISKFGRPELKEFIENNKIVLKGGRSKKLKRRRRKSLKKLSRRKKNSRRKRNLK